MDLKIIPAKSAATTFGNGGAAFRREFGRGEIVLYLLRLRRDLGGIVHSPEHCRGRSKDMG